MHWGISMRVDVVKTIAAADILVDYTPVGTPLDHPSRALIFQNYTNGDIQLSFNGIADNFPLLNNTQFILDASSNQVDIQGFFLARGTQIWARQLPGGVVPTTGTFYVTAIYGKGD